jgi:hypothetical protein
MTAIITGLFFVLFCMFYLLKKKRKISGWVPGDGARAALRFVPMIVVVILTPYIAFNLITPHHAADEDFIYLAFIATLAVVLIWLVWEFVLHRWIFQPTPVHNPVDFQVKEKSVDNSVDFEITSEADNGAALPSDDKLFEKVWAEIEAGEIEQGLWARLWAGNSGDEVRTKAAYLNARVDQIKTEPTKPLVSLRTDGDSSSEFTVHYGGHIVPKIADAEEDEVRVTDATDRAEVSEINQASSSNFTVHYGGHIVGQPPNTEEEKPVLGGLTRIEIVLIIVSAVLILSIIIKRW